MSTCETDTLTLTCHFTPKCGYNAGTKKVPHGAYAAPSTVAQWHDRMAAHVRKVHVRKSGATA